MSCVTLASARALVRHCERRGVDTTDMLRGAGIDAAHLADPDGTLSAEAAHVLWWHAYAQLNDPALAMHVAEAVPHGHYQLFHFLCVYAASPGDAFAQLCEHAVCADGQRRFALVREPGRTAVYITDHDGNDCGAQLRAEFSLAMAYLGVVRSTGAELAPVQVELLGEPPEDTAPWRRVFAAPVRFGAARSCLWFDDSLWTLPVQRANADLLRILKAHGTLMQRRLPPGEPSLQLRVRQAIEERLTQRPLGVAQVARALGMSRRSLQRALQEAGTSFSAEVEGVRLARARRLLADRQRSLTEIALELGFSEHSAFTRAYRRWTGSPPGTDREQVRPRLG